MLFTWNSRARHSNVRSSWRPRDCSTSQVLATCSMHGEKEHILPPDVLMADRACGRASHGLGRSRNTASATPSTPKPSSQTSRCNTMTRSPNPCRMNSSDATFTLSLWKSKVCSFPVGPMALRMAWESEPLPVPASHTTDPGPISSWVNTMDMSGV